LTTAVLAAAGFVCAQLASAAPKSAEQRASASQSSQPPGEKACREAVNGLISMLDAKLDDASNYRDTYKAVVETCGLAAPAPKPKTPPPGRDACYDLAAAMVDLIEDGKMDTAAFVKARSDFADTCPPK
jgi:hypothetical protein